MVESNNQPEEERMLYVTFNQDSSCFAIGTETGFKIYNVFPYKDTFSRDLEGGIGIIEMYNRSNILILVGGGKSPKFALNKVIIWDDRQNRVISELRFTSTVKNVKIKQDKLFVVCEQKIYVFLFNSLETIDTMDTYNNPKGIVAIATTQNCTILAYPDKTKGYVRVKSYDAPSNTPLLNAHESQIACLSINLEGTLLATASDKGTIIRIFKIEDGSLVQELRRGAEKAEIYSISFDPMSKFLSCTSDRKTIHIFSLTTVNKALNEGTVMSEEREKEDDSEPKNQKSFLGKITKFLKFPKGYWDSEWSFAQFRIKDLKAICTFGVDNTIFVISAYGNYYQATFDPRSGGECTQIQEYDLKL